ncbi:TetR/AcrR family transcriptional regulator [Sphingobacterium sp. CZ-2]|uniref:TetR/AcrR family transcriptional regulator n=1 Tax=Sphingobacterium sp. CZ-2 TaxID=2557994 RepID=UPI00106F1195|nr:TetR/AcrR family transcriptional regulator [Sphingobacterium sp. CZ-2]QBR12695.1 TetR/AcrR family transcriptional regulator [Sphingobacterium sp. CZ-2]
MNIQLTEKKEQIFRSTLQLVNAGGFHGSPMSKIAKEAEVAVGSIYHYFPSKDDLIIELYWYCKEIINKHIFLEEQDNLPYDQRFRAVWKNVVLFYQDHEDLFSFMEQFYGSPFYEDIRKNVFQHKCERNKIFHFLEQGLEEKHLKDLHVRILLAAYLGPAISLVRSSLYEKTKIEESQLDQLVDIIWNGVKK